MGDLAENKKRFGFVAVIGAPNVGKSTFINRVVGSKISIVTPKVQTTRTNILGITIRGNSQIVFIDTPGIFSPRKRFDRAMVDAAWTAVTEGDHIIIMVDASRGIASDTKSLLSSITNGQRNLILVLNKIDIVRPEDLLSLSHALNKLGTFSATFMISATSGSGVNDILTYLEERISEGPWHFPEDQISDLPIRVLAAEITREQLFLSLRQELPYAVTVETENWEEFSDKSVKISQTIYVQRDTQKAIVLGKGGNMIKKISTAARNELCKCFERDVHLFLFVKVRGKWMEDQERYQVLGLKFDV
tara:strand:- start:210 stop:1121 length:912 start_codon:yes stop_codon:yes gene_type:complete